MLEEFSLFVKLNVGGRTFLTSKQTLRSKGTNFLSLLLDKEEDGSMTIEKDDQGCILVDRSGELFAVVLEYLRTGFVFFDKNKFSKTQVENEFDFYQIVLQTGALSEDQKVNNELWKAVEVGVQKIQNEVEEWFEPYKVPLMKKIVAAAESGQFLSTGNLEPITIDTNFSSLGEPEYLFLRIIEAYLHRELNLDAKVQFHTRERCTVGLNVSVRTSHWVPSCWLADYFDTNK
eukprot:CAMPEP_0174263172 /NCGR_PEP_ID=MMETSP0439-20130205/17465_1 /TAXON_ID=0 /ORGANISM="Stereomyxa ramosa, Strain Chinc5" /LENGTH=231 /DNA_ID=CAMNT_0015348365 /DNA_START=59 /DNA_END=754 /DNA_ORIENTATION=-